MRIGFDISKGCPPRDGIGTYSVELLRALIDQARDCELWLYASLQPIADSVIHDLLPTLPPFVRWTAQVGPAPGEVDLFHATTWTPPIGFDGPVVFTCYDLTVLSHPEAHTIANRTHVLTGLLEARRLDMTFLAISRATAEALGHWLDVAPERLRVIYPGVGARFQPMDASAAAPVLTRFGLQDQGYVLTVSSREPRKNLERLVEAHTRLPATLRESNPLVVVGGAGWRNDRLNERLATASADGTVVLLENVEDDDLPALYSRAAAFAYPSLAEGFGLPVLEALACGAPTVTSDRSSLPEVAGDAALQVDPLDVAALSQTLHQLLDDAPGAARLRDAGPERATQFQWPDTANAVLALYKELIEEASR